MFPLRSHLSASTAALVLVIPVVVGVAMGGFGAGVVAAGAGFLIYDLVFIPPYYTLSVGVAQNWVGLGVYAIVTVVVTRVVAAVSVARTEAQERAAELRRLFDLSAYPGTGSSVRLHPADGGRRGGHLTRGAAIDLTAPDRPRRRQVADKERLLAKPFAGREPPHQPSGPRASRKRAMMGPSVGPPLPVPWCTMAKAISPDTRSARRRWVGVAGAVLGGAGLGISAGGQTGAGRRPIGDHCRIICRSRRWRPRQSGAGGVSAAPTTSGGADHPGVDRRRNHRHVQR